MPTPAQTPYEQLGGEAALRHLVQRFYELMDTLPETHALRQLHPQDLSGSKTSLFEFLSGWFGGPSLYIAKKGHPRLRMRHAPYAIDVTLRDQWLLCMQQTLSEQVADTAFRTSLNTTFEQMATHLINAE
jgi:hemoglobin